MTVSLLPVLAAASADSPPAWLQFLPFIGMGLVMWFFLLRPQMQQQKQQKAKLEALKKGDQVLTGGGFIGKVVKVDADYVDVELAPGLKVKALKSTIGDVIPPSGGAPAND
ncbi:preprotein translocase subunit YajC [Novosphingobium rosa]|uniref:preprotein translocase subunit YajC n=1 Tax=Novosphingobium rosa TaxID=76978 RepID=UPI00082D7F6D|nr:preprotein translocase subunit YajC [Novosphingobium rosa]